MFCFESVIGRYAAFQRSGAPVRLDVGEASKDTEYSDQARKGSYCHLLFALIRTFPVPHFCTGQHHSQANHSVCPAAPIGCTDTSQFCRCKQSHSNIGCSRLVILTRTLPPPLPPPSPHTQGIYLPFFSPPSAADPTPIFIAYLGGDGEGGSMHFVPLVCQEWDNAAPLRISLQVISSFHSISCNEM